MVLVWIIIAKKSYLWCSYRLWIIDHVLQFPGISYSILPPLYKMRSHTPQLPVCLNIMVKRIFSFSISWPLGSTNTSDCAMFVCNSSSASSLYIKKNLNERNRKHRVNNNNNNNSWIKNKKWGHKKEMILVEKKTILHLLLCRFQFFGFFLNW